MERSKKLKKKPAKKKSCRLEETTLQGLKKHDTKLKFTKKKENFVLLALLGRDRFYRPRVWHCNKKAKQRKEKTFSVVKDTKSSRLLLRSKTSFLATSHESENEHQKQVPGTKLCEGSRRKPSLSRLRSRSQSPSGRSCHGVHKTTPKTRPNSQVSFHEDLVCPDSKDCEDSPRKVCEGNLNIDSDGQSVISEKNIPEDIEDCKMDCLASTRIKSGMEYTVKLYRPSRLFAKDEPKRGRKTGKKREKSGSAGELRDTESREWDLCTEPGMTGIQADEPKGTVPTSNVCIPKSSRDHSAKESNLKNYEVEPSYRINGEPIEYKGRVILVKEATPQIEDEADGDILNSLSPNPLVAEEAAKPEDKVFESMEAMHLEKRGANFRKALTDWLKDSASETLSSERSTDTFSTGTAEEEQKAPTQEVTEDKQENLLAGKNPVQGEDKSFSNQKKAEENQTFIAETIRLSIIEQKPAREQVGEHLFIADLVELCRPDGEEDAQIVAPIGDHALAVEQWVNVHTKLSESKTEEGKREENSGSQTYSDEVSYLERKAVEQRDVQKQKQTTYIDEDDLTECRQQYKTEVLQLSKQLQAFKENCDSEMKKMEKKLKKKKKSLDEKMAEVEKEKQTLSLPILLEQLQQEKGLLDKQQQLLVLEDGLVAREEELTARQKELQARETELEEIEGFLQRRYDMAKSREDGLMEMEMVLRDLKQDLHEDQEVLQAQGRVLAKDTEVSTRAARNWDLLRINLNQTKRSLQASLDQTKVELSRTQSREEEKEGIIKELKGKIKVLEKAQSDRDRHIKELGAHLSVHIHESLQCDNQASSVTLDTPESMTTVDTPVIKPKKLSKQSSLSSLGVKWRAQAPHNLDRPEGKIRVGMQRHQSLLQIGEGMMVSTPNRRPKEYEDKTIPDLHSLWKAAEAKRNQDMMKFSNFNRKSKCVVM